MACSWKWATSESNKDHSPAPAPKRRKACGSNRDDSSTGMEVVQCDGKLSSHFVLESGATPSEPEMQSYYERCEAILDDEYKRPCRHSRLGLDLVGKTGLCAVPRIPKQVWTPDLGPPPTPSVLAEYMKDINWQQTFHRRASGNSEAEPMYKVDNHCTRIGEIRAYSFEQVASLRAKSDDAAQALQRLKTFDHEKQRRPSGFYFYMSVSKLEHAFYQDGTPVVEDELSFYHGTNEGLYNSILAKGVCASIPSHSAEGLWVFSLLSPESYDWGMSSLQYFAGHVLHLKIPASCECLRQNRRIRGGSEHTGHLRWVLNGKHLSPHLRCRIVGIYVRIPSEAYMQWIRAFKQSVRNCIPWCHHGTFEPLSQVPAQVANTPEGKLKILCKGHGKWGGHALHCLGKNVMCRGVGQQCLQYCVLARRHKDVEERLKHILPDATLTRRDKLRQESKMKSQLLMCVERRLVYACAVGKAAAFSAEGADCILQSSSDIFTGSQPVFISQNQTF